VTVSRDCCTGRSLTFAGAGSGIDIVMLAALIGGVGDLRRALGTTRHGTYRLSFAPWLFY